MAEARPGDTALKVLVVDDHPIVREGLAYMLRDAGYLVFEADSGEHAVDIASSIRPELVVMDVLMPGMSGIEATERIAARDPVVRVLMLSVADSAETVRAAVKAGAAGYLTKAATSRASLLDALSRTAAGERVFIPGGLVDALVYEPAQLSQSAARFTVREKEIIALAAHGMANAAIAAALGLSSRTVENHLARIFRKLGITSRTQLARVAIDQQIDRYPWAGQACTIIFADIAAFAAPTRSTRDQMALRKAMYEILRDAFTRSGIPWPAGQVEDRGDGMLILVPPGVPTSTVIDPCLAALADNLKRYNSATSESTNMQLRVALHTGAVAADALGVSGEAIVRASRLVDAQMFREALQTSGADLGVIVSDSIYDTVIKRGGLSLDPADLQSVDIHVKELETTAWMWFSGYAPSSGTSEAGQASQEVEAEVLSGAHSGGYTSLPRQSAAQHVPRVFVSYAHDDHRHIEAVRALSEFLAVDCGLDVHLDRWDLYRRRDWYTWAHAQIIEADFVLVIASPMYKAIGDGERPDEIHRGMQSELSLIRELLHSDHAKWQVKLLPVVLPGRSVGEIPLFLQPQTAGHYQVTEFTVAGAGDLLRVITAPPQMLRVKGPQQDRPISSRPVG